MDGFAHPFALRNVVGMSGTKLVNRLRARDAADDDEALALIREALPALGAKEISDVRPGSPPRYDPTFEVALDLVRKPA